jgi:hypothetical protein
MLSHTLAPDGLVSGLLRRWHHAAGLVLFSRARMFSGCGVASQRVLPRWVAQIGSVRFGSFCLFGMFNAVPGQW